MFVHASDFIVLSDLSLWVTFLMKDFSGIIVLLMKSSVSDQDCLLEGSWVYEVLP